jgi:sulfofructose kinase
MTENPVVAFVGIATIDMIFGVETLPEGPTKNFAHCYREVAGGVAARAAMTAAKLGANTRMIGRIGDDDAGEMLRRTLERVGVDCHFLTPVPGRTTPVSAIFVDRDRQRMLVNYKDAELFAGAELPKGALNGVDAVMCDLRWPPGAMTALDVASRMGVPGVLDFDKSPERGTHRLINRASHVVFGEEALCGLTAGADLGARLARVAGHNPGRNFAVTAGEKGVVWRSWRRSPPSAPATPSTAPRRLRWPRGGASRRRCASPTPPPGSRSPGRTSRGTCRRWRRSTR